MTKELCNRCEENEKIYADGKTHYYSDNAPTIQCSQCNGEGYLPKDCATGPWEYPPADLPHCYLLVEYTDNYNWRLNIYDNREGIYNSVGFKRWARINTEK